MQRPSKPMPHRQLRAVAASVSIVIGCARGNWIVPLSRNPGAGLDLVRGGSARAPANRNGKSENARGDEGSSRERIRLSHHNTVYRQNLASRIAIRPRIDSVDGPDSPPYRGHRVPAVPHVLRSRDRPGHLRGRTLSVAVQLRRPAQRQPLHGVRAVGVRHGDRRRAIRGGRARPWLRHTETGARAAGVLRVLGRARPRTTARRGVSLHATGASPTSRTPPPAACARSISDRGSTERERSSSSADPEQDPRIRCRRPGEPGIPMDQIRRGNYDSGQDYVLEYGELRFTFNERDFSERVEQAARKLGFVGDPLAGDRARGPREPHRQRRGRRPRLRPRRARQRLLAGPRRPRRPLARALAAAARLPLRLARPAREGGRAGRRLRRRPRTPSATSSPSATASRSSSRPSRAGAASPTGRSATEATAGARARSSPARGLKDYSAERFGARLRAPGLRVAAGFLAAVAGLAVAAGFAAARLRAGLRGRGLGGGRRLSRRLRGRLGRPLGGRLGRRGRLGRALAGRRLAAGAGLLACALGLADRARERPGFAAGPLRPRRPARARPRRRHRLGHDDGHRLDEERLRDGERLRRRSGARPRGSRRSRPHPRAARDAACRTRSARAPGSCPRRPRRGRA